MKIWTYRQITNTAHRTNTSIVDVAVPDLASPEAMASEAATLAYYGSALA